MIGQFKTYKHFESGTLFTTYLEDYVLIPKDSKLYKSFFSSITTAKDFSTKFPELLIRNLKDNTEYLKNISLYITKSGQLDKKLIIAESSKLNVYEYDLNFVDINDNVTKFPIFNNNQPYYNRESYYSFQLVNGFINCKKVLIEDSYYYYDCPVDISNNYYFDDDKLLYRNNTDSLNTREFKIPWKQSIVITKNKECQLKSLVIDGIKKTFANNGIIYNKVDTSNKYITIKIPDDSQDNGIIEIR